MTSTDRRAGRRPGGPGWVRLHWKGLLGAGVVALVLLVVGVPYAYIHLLSGDQPDPLSLADVPAATATTARGSGASPGSAGGPAVTAPVTDLAGRWTAGPGSRAGYRVQETLAGQHTTAVGRTSSVTGSLTVAGTAITAAQFSVQMATVTSDRSERDAKFAGSIMQTDRYPTGTFELTEPVRLGSAPAVGATITATARGELTLHGVTRAVSVPVSAKRLASSIAVTGSTTINYRDYDIDNPSFGGFVSVGDSGTIEFLLVLTK